MASIFDKLDQSAQAVFDENLGEAVTFMSGSRGGYVETADPTRRAQNITAVPSISPRSGANSEGVQGRSSTGSQRTFQNCELWVSAEQAALLSWVPRRDDFAQLETNGKPVRYRILSVVPMGQHDLNITMTEEEAVDE